MKSLMLLVVSFCCVFSFNAQAAASAPAVRSYKEWKSDKIQAALSQILVVRNQLLKAQSEGNQKSRETHQKQLSQLQWNLEVANDLSVTDYFVLYLSQQSQPDRYHQAAQKLTSSEVAELMEAYSGALGIGQAASNATTALSPVISNANSKIPSQATKNNQ